MQKSKKIWTIRGTIVIFLVAVFAFLLIIISPGGALQLANRTVTVNTSQPSANTTHSFTFDIATVAGIGSIEFEYCTNDPFVGTPCTAPAGLDVSGAGIAVQQGEAGFSMHANTTSNRLLITRAPAIATGGPVRYDFSNTINPSTPQQTVYVRLATYVNDDGTGAFIDEGGVVFSTSGSLGVGGYVPPHMTFCVGLSVALHCESATGDKINLGELSTQVPSIASSQMSAFTNDLSGYDIFVQGITMTSGNNIIPGLLSGVSNPGTSQFGINLRANSSPAIGSDPVGPGVGFASSGYNASNVFRFVNGEKVAESNMPTDADIYTVSYMVNIHDNQPAGVYSTTLTYVAVAQF
jgi:hypothetical protein